MVVETQSVAQDHLTLSSSQSSSSSPLIQRLSTQIAACDHMHESSDHIAHHGAETIKTTLNNSAEKIAPGKPPIAGVFVRFADL